MLHCVTATTEAKSGNVSNSLAAAASTTASLAANAVAANTLSVLFTFCQLLGVDKLSRFMLKQLAHL